MIQLWRSHPDLPSFQAEQDRRADFARQLLRALFARRYADRLTGTAEAPVVADHVFHVKGKPMGDIRKAWNTACLAAGIQQRTVLRKGKKIVVAGKRPHAFRRTATRDLTRAGAPQTVVMSITGHKTASMFQRYNITSGADQREAIAALAARRVGAA